MSRGTVAFVDDEPALCAATADWLETSGFAVETWCDPVAACQAIDPQRFDAVVTDLRMPEMPGDRLMAALRDRDPDLPVILMSAHADVALAVAAMREGAHHFVEKPCLPEFLVAVLDRAVEWRRLRREVALPPTPPRGQRLDQRLPGRSAAIRRLRDQVTALADVAVDLLITGPQGSGRESLARLVHDLSPRSRRPFVALDCAALPEPVLTAELFGDERSERAGRLEHARGGTVYLAEIDALSPALQARLMRVVLDQAVLRQGGTVPRPVDLRLIAGTTLDLTAEMAAGRFRQDLGFRLTSAGLAVPGLAARRDDIPLIYSHFLADAARRFRRSLPEPLPAELDSLASRPWPGNLPQLMRAAERHVLGLRDAPQAPDTPDLPLPRQLAAFEARVISDALDRCGGSSAAAAELLGVPRRTLNEKIARLGLRSLA